ncbi:MAG: thioredoxin family protein [Pirellulaceae bacterium]|nr:thioredoxin family protein [Pirellulaceae bacterium]
MLSRTKSALCMALALSILAFSCPITVAQEIHWAPDIAAARRASIEYKVPVLIHFYGDNCLPCKLLEQNVLNRTEVVDTLNKYFICVKINASQERSTAAQYGVHSWPTDVFISPDGKTLDQGTCKQTPAAYLSVLHGIAVMNRDRNVMFAAEQTDRADQVTSQVANYAQPATAAPAGLPAAGQVAPANPQGPNFYSQGAGSAMQQLPNSLAPGTAVASGPLLSQNQPHPITTAVQAAGNQIAPAAGPRELNTSDGHLPPMEFAGQISGAQSGRGTDPLAAVVATTAPTVPAPPAIATQAINAWNQPQSTPTTGNQGQTVDNPHFNPAPATQQVAAGPIGPAPPGNPQIAGMQSVAPALPNMANSNSPNTTAPALPNVAAAQPAASAPKIPASTVSFQPRNALSSDANTLEAQTQATPTKAETASVALDGYCPVALKTQGAWISGLPQYAVKHRGRVYHLSSPEAMREFLQNPDSSSPVMSGYDAMIFLTEGKLVEGSIQYGLHEQISGAVLLFVSAESKQAYEQNFDRNTQALKILLHNAGVTQ